MENKLNLDHFGKHVYVGIDVHRKTYTITALADHFPYPYKVGGIAADPDRFIDWLKKRFLGAEIHTAYEAGFSGFVLHRKLKTAGIDSIVVNPGSIEVAVGNHVKTDKRDSAKIAEHLYQKRIGGIHIPSKALEEARQITRTRYQLTKKKTGIGNQIKAKLIQFGFIEHDDDRKICKSYINKFVATLKLATDLRIAIDCLSAVYLCLDEQIKILDARIKAQAEKDKKIDSIYQSVPGIGPVWARTLCNEIGDMTQFTSEKKLFSFLGFTPTESSSGETRIQGHISRQGRAILRMVLCEAAWVAVARDPALARSYHKIKIRRGGKRAIIAIARKMTARIRHCLIQQEVYLLGYGETDIKPRLKSELRRTTVLEAMKVA